MCCQICEETCANCLNKVVEGVITGTFSLNFLLVVKIVHLVDRTYLFKIVNLVLDGKEILTSLYSRLEGQRHRDKEPVGRMQGFA
jgi:hypothetical protein